MSIRYIKKLYNIPTTGIVGSYGGGDQLQMARQIFIHPFTPDIIPKSIKNQIISSINESIKQKSKSDIIKLPSECPDLSQLEWSSSLQISSHVYGENSFNLFYHGWLFEKNFKNNIERGCIKYPLVGLFESVGLSKQTKEKKSDDVEYIGIDCLKPADQHVHYIEETGYWHFGSDMARFSIDSTYPVAHFWAVCVDLFEKRVDVCFLIIVSGELEEPLEHILKKSKKEREEKIDIFLFLEFLPNTLMIPIPFLSDIRKVLKKN